MGARYGLMLALLLVLAAIHALWFLFGPQPPCPPEVASCSGSPLPVISFFVACVLLNVGNAVALKRAGYSRSDVVNNVTLLAISTLVLMGIAGAIAVRIFILGHPT